MATGIWTHAPLFGDDGAPARLATERRWTLGEAATPAQEWPSLARELGLERLVLKREDLNPGGSHKDRGLLYQIAACRAEDDHPRTFVLSSSGNAAVAAASVTRVTGDRLLAFVSPRTAPAKARRLRTSGADLVVSDKPINFARYATRVFGLTDLRGTKDPRAATGYRSIAGELAPFRPDHVLTFSSSGTSMRGIAEGFAQLDLPVACTAVQAGVCLGIARALRPDLEEEPDNPAGRLGIRNPPDAETLARYLASSGGGAVCVRTAGVMAMAERLSSRSEADGGSLRVSPEGAAVLAAVVDGAREGRLRGTVVAIITGRGDQWHDDTTDALDDPDLPRVGSYLELRDALLARGLEPV